MQKSFFIVWVVVFLSSTMCRQSLALNSSTDISSSIDMNKRTEELKNLRFGMFVCWSFSTFSNVEWTRGIKNVAWFSPTGCDTDNWCSTAKEAQMGYILFLTKHHDGFCLWDTDTTDWKVTKSPLGIDVLAKLKKSCQKYGLKLALYFSEGDWTWPEYKNPELKKAQLQELLTRYGPIEFIWFDHAQTDGGLSHDETAKWVKKFQPGCFVGFNHGAPAGDIRLGEMGRPGSLDETDAAGFNAEHMKGYSGYMLAEFTYPILGGRGAGRWFYTMPEWDNVCVPAEQIYKDYMGAAEHGNIFSLDTGPDRRGLLRDIDIAALRKTGQYIRGEIKLPAQPSPQQLAWHEMEMEMFLCLDPCTWQNREYDNHTTPLSQINPEKLDTDQWCTVAKSFGAKQILFVAKHTGGFCWWQTETTDYSIKNTPWKNGKGDVLAELADSCRRHGLKLGIYVYPGDDTWDAPIGSGGKTKDPAKQQAYNKVFRQQMTEVLSKYGQVSEVWFDGSCVIDVSDILKKYAPGTMVFQGPCATIRWVGNEQGIGPEPNWNAVKKADAVTGVATSANSDPDGDVWLPNEVDTTLLDHKWFWGQNTDHMIKPLDKLMDIFYKSVGRGCVLLLNATPDTSGLIPPSHEKSYKEFGEEIRRRFGKSIAETTGTGRIVELKLEKPTIINHLISMEDISQGQRIRKYVIEGLINNEWKALCQGTSVGYKKIDFFEPAAVSKLRINVTESAGEPIIKKLAVFHARTTTTDQADTETIWQNAFVWDGDNVKAEWTTLTIDLTKYVSAAGQYNVFFKKTSGTGDIEIDSVTAVLEGMDTPGFATALKQKNMFNINRTASVEKDKGTTALKVVLRRTGPCRGEVLIRSALN